MAIDRRARRAAVLFLIGVPAAATAHVKWFVTTEAIAPVESLQFRMTDPAVQIWAAVVGLVVLTAYLLDRMDLAPPSGLLRIGEQGRGRILYLFQSIVGLSLLGAAVQGAVLVPHLREGTLLTAAFRVGEGLVGLLFVSNLWAFGAAIFLLVLYAASAAVFGVLMSLEYANLFGIALFLLLLKAPETSPIARWRPWALPLLRVHLGVAISILAFSEKLLRPELAMDFLARHKLNFMPLLGFEGFSDHLFVLSAGSSELIFGLIFILGLVTRINTVTIAGFLVSTNVYFFALGKVSEGFLELMGHANLVAIALILVFYGAGEKLRLPHVRCGQRAGELAPSRLGAHAHPRACEVVESARGVEPRPPFPSGATLP